MTLVQGWSDLYVGNVFKIVHGRNKLSLIREELSSSGHSREGVMVNSEWLFVLQGLIGGSITVTLSEPAMGCLPPA